MLLKLELWIFLVVSVFGLNIPPLYQKILDELSWTLKIKLLEDYIGNTTTSTTLSPKGRRVGIESLIMAEPGKLEEIMPKKTDISKSIYVSNGFKKDSTQDRSKYFEKGPGESFKSSRYLENRSRRYMSNNYQPSRDIEDERFQDSSHVMREERRQGNLPPEPPVTIATDEENDMRMKLFRLMYETVRDSDLKVKRAELIKTHYQNSSLFDVGYLISDITDKYSVMQDVSKTLQRLYNEWKPIEHINAYEQIANQAIQISQLIDMARLIGRKGNLTYSGK